MKVLKDAQSELERRSDLLDEALDVLGKLVEGRVTVSSAALHPSGRFCHSCGLNSTESVHVVGCPVGAAEAILDKAGRTTEGRMRMSETIHPDAVFCPHCDNDAPEGNGYVLCVHQQDAADLQRRAALVEEMAKGLQDMLTIFDRGLQPGSLEYINCKRAHALLAKVREGKGEVSG